jgi:hypothetical protein
MSNVSDGPATPTPKAAAETLRPRRIRLVKAMAKQARNATAVQTPHGKSRRLSQEDELQLDAIKRRLAGQGIRVRKGELLAAALRVLGKLDDALLREALAAPDQADPGRSGFAS